MSSLARPLPVEPSGDGFQVPEPFALADWRLRIAALYTQVRAMTEPKAAWRHWHATRSALFRAHPASPLSPDVAADFGDIPVYDYRPELRFEVEVAPFTGDAEEVMLGADGTLHRRPIGRTKGLAGPLGAELTLWWIEGYGGGLFLPFTDTTNGEETYGGGRYLIDAIKGADLGLTDDGRAVLDFNFAYHPSCALNDGWVCPLAPPANGLPSAIRAGERLPAAA